MNENLHITPNDILDESSVLADPIRQFQRWYADVLAARIPFGDAMTLATSTPDGIPSARIVLLKQVDERGFIFYTNYHSRKSKELEDNAVAALLFHWKEFDRQVRIEGSVSRGSREESERYFQTRPRESQIGALASDQSSVIASREELERRAVQIEQQFSGKSIPCPPHWGAYIVKPLRMEFWKSREGRLHDRILYERDAKDQWTIKRLAP